MTATVFKMSDKASESFEITPESVRDEMQGKVAAIVDIAPHRNRKAAIAWTAKNLCLPFGRVRSLFYGEARRIDAHEADKIRAYVEAAEKMMNARAEYEATRADFIRNYPRLSRFVPGPLGGSEAPGVGALDAAAASGKRRAG